MFNIDLNKKAAIIKEISVPRYPQLKALYLGDNNISSIEMLGALDAPLLEKLYLSTQYASQTITKSYA